MTEIAVRLPVPVVLALSQLGLLEAARRKTTVPDGHGACIGLTLVCLHLKDAGAVVRCPAAPGFLRAVDSVTVDSVTVDVRLCKHAVDAARRLTQADPDADDATRVLAVVGAVWEMGARAEW